MHKKARWILGAGKKMVQRSSKIQVSEQPGQLIDVSSWSVPDHAVRWLEEGRSRPYSLAVASDRANRQLWQPWQLRLAGSGHRLTGLPASCYGD